MSIKIMHKLSEDMAIHGTLLLIFGLLLFAVEPVNKAHIYLIPTWLIPSPPACLCLALRIILITASLIFVVAIPLIWRAKLVHRLKGWCKTAVLWIMFFLELAIFVFLLWLIPPIPAPDLLYKVLGGFALLISLTFMIAFLCECLAGKLEKAAKGRFQWIYWFIFLLVYRVSISQGLLKLAQGSLAYKSVTYFDIAWSVVIMIIFSKAFLSFAQSLSAGRKTPG